MKNVVTLFAFGWLLFGCGQKQNISEADLKNEIIKAETDFKNLAATKGIAEAFYTFADDAAVIKREHDTLIKGKENIRNYYAKQDLSQTTVTWSPEFISVADDGTLGYTYGNYVWTTKDSLNKENRSTGVFHTVWKKQKDGTWKYVWD